MIPSNANHEDFFHASSIHAGLTDNDYNVKLHAANIIVPSAEQIRNAESKPVLLTGQNTLLKSHPVRGGHFYWFEDVSEINRLNQELADTGNYLEEEHA